MCLGGGRVRCNGINVLFQQQGWNIFLCVCIHTPSLSIKPFNCNLCFVLQYKWISTLLYHLKTDHPVYDSVVLIKISHYSTATDQDPHTSTHTWHHTHNWHTTHTLLTHHIYTWHTHGTTHTNTYTETEDACLSLSLSLSHSHTHTHTPRGMHTCARTSARTLA